MPFATGDTQIRQTERIEPQSCEAIVAARLRARIEQLEAALTSAKAVLLEHMPIPQVLNEIDRALDAHNSVISPVSDDPECPKCGAISGDSWGNCKGSCPVVGSPHYDAKATGAPWSPRDSRNLPAKGSEP